MCDAVAVSQFVRLRIGEMIFASSPNLGHLTYCTILVPVQSYRYVTTDPKYKTIDNHNGRMPVAAALTERFMRNEGEQSEVWRPKSLNPKKVNKIPRTEFVSARSSRPFIVEMSMKSKCRLLRFNLFWVGHTGYDIFSDITCVTRTRASQVRARNNFCLSAPRDEHIRTSQSVSQSVSPKPHTQTHYHRPTVR
jgi:hypothetical protein